MLSGGHAAINSRLYPVLGRAQQSGCSDMLGLAQCVDVLVARQSYRRPAPGVTQTVFRSAVAAMHIV
jgi:hypothetical protein